MTTETTTQVTDATTAESAPAKPSGRKRTTAPTGQPAAITAEQLMADTYTPGDLRKMTQTGSAATKKLARAELTRRAQIAQDAARAKNRVTVAPGVSAAAKKVVEAQQAAANAERDAVLAHLKANPNASAPDTFRATGVSYSKVRKHAEAAGHRFAAQDRAVARVLTAAEAKQLHALEEKMGSSLSVLARALRNFDNA